MVHCSLFIVHCVEVGRLETIMSKTYQNRKFAIRRLRDSAIAKKTKIKRRSFLKKAGLISVLVGGGLV